MKKEIELLKNLDYRTSESVFEAFEKGIRPLYNKLKRNNQLTSSLVLLFDKLDDELETNVAEEIEIANFNKFTLGFVGDLKNRQSDEIEIAETDFLISKLEEDCSTKYRQLMKTLVNSLISKVELLEK